MTSKTEPFVSYLFNKGETFEQQRTREYELRMTVVLRKKFRDDADAIEWIENHTVFDMLDANAVVIDDLVFTLPQHDLIYDGVSK